MVAAPSCVQPHRGRSKLQAEERLHTIAGSLLHRSMTHQRAGHRIPQLKMIAHDGKSVNFYGEIPVQMKQLGFKPGFAVIVILARVWVSTTEPTASNAAR
jgi:hypothetical protein